MSELVLKVSKRTETGKNENNRLRASGRVPINMISNGQSMMGSVDQAEITHILNAGIRPATLLELEIEGSEKVKAFVKEIQRFPATNQVRHIDFYKVTPGKKITAKVRIDTTGVAKGSKAGGQFVHLIHEITVKSTPEDMIDLITVDVTDLDVGESVKVSNLKTPPSWEIQVNGDPIITSVNKTKALLAAERSEKMASTGDKDKGKGKAAPKKK
ncbi:MAG: 50S ribosomal protein L25/general stress protein Ctc [Leptospiraceae bacterium]|nr:50S ribosomal protein L25/general stress protein Ctc [Leptospiraceae bacterium]MCP5510254.1 50S ribosomal protein L25/general stress protein Ctc [Leptospiraceae bacterium]